MKKLIGSMLALAFLLSMAVPAMAAFPRPPLIVTEQDSDPLAVPRRLVFPNDTLLDQGGGVFQLDLASAGDFTTLSASTVALQLQIDINTGQLLQVAIDTTALQVAIDANASQIVLLDISTQSLQAQIDALDLSEIAALSVSTALLRIDVDLNTAQLLAVAVDTTTLGVTLAQVQLDTAAIQVALDAHILVTSAHGATPLNTVDLIVRRDGSGNFAAGTITAALAGNSDTTTALAADPADAGDGFVSGGITANGTAVKIEVSDTQGVDGSTLPVSANGLFDHDATVDAHHAATLDTGPTQDCAGTQLQASDGSCPEQAAVGVDTFVTNLDSHDHLGGDGATIAHTSLDTVGGSDHHAPTVSGDITHDSTVGGTTPAAHHDPDLRVLRAGDTMTGQLTIAGSSLTVQQDIQGSSVIALSGLYVNQTDGQGLVQISSGAFYKDGPGQVYLNGLSVTESGATGVTLRHIGASVGTGYALFMQSNGATFLNASTIGLFFRTGNVDRGSFNAAGNFIVNNSLGVGAAPTIDAFEVALNARILGDFRTFGSVSFGDTAFGNPFQVHTSSLVVATGGNVGIGTDSPSENLEVVGNIKADKLVFDSTTINGLDMFFPGVAPTVGQIPTATSSSAFTWQTPSAGGSIEVEDEGSPLTSAVTKFNFAGAGVTVTEPVADEILVTIPGVGGVAAGVFVGTSAAETDPVDITGGSYVTILTTGATMTATPARVDCMVSIANAGTPVEPVFVQIFEDGSPISQEFQTRFKANAGSNPENRFIAAQEVITPTAAHHTYTCRVKITGGGLDSEAFGRSMIIDQRLVSTPASASVRIATDTTASTTLAAAVFSKIGGTCTAGSLSLFEHSTNCRMTYTGALPITLIFEASLGVSKAGGGATDGFFRLVMNGDANATEAFQQQSLRNLPNSSDIGSVTLHAQFDMVNGDFVEPYFMTTNGDDLTAESLSWVAGE